MTGRNWRDVRAETNLDGDRVARIQQEMRDAERAYREAHPEELADDPDAVPGAGSTE